jgi:hypothetical protein
MIENPALPFLNFHFYLKNMFRFIYKTHRKKNNASTYKKIYRLNDYIENCSPKILKIKKALK